MKIRHKVPPRERAEYEERSTFERLKAVKELMTTTLFFAVTAGFGVMAVYYAIYLARAPKVYLLESIQGPAEFKIDDPADYKRDVIARLRELRSRTDLQGPMRFTLAVASPEPRLPEVKLPETDLLLQRLYQSMDAAFGHTLKIRVVVRPKEPVNYGAPDPNRYTLSVAVIQSGQSEPARTLETEFGSKGTTPPQALKNELVDRLLYLTEPVVYATHHSDDKNIVHHVAEGLMQSDPRSGLLLKFIALDVSKDSSPKELQAALSDARELLRVGGKSYAPGHESLGIVYFYLKDFPKAVAAFRQARAVAPESVDARAELAAVLTYAGRPAEGFAELADLATRHPAGVEIHDALISWAEEADEASFLTTHPEINDANREEAERAAVWVPRAYELALRDLPNESKYLFDYARAMWYIKHDKNAAIAAAEKGVRLDPFHAWNYASLARTYEAVGDPRWYESFRKAFEMAPNDHATEFGYLLLKYNRAGEAAGLLAGLGDVAGERYAYMFARALMQNNRSKEAIDYFEKVKEYERDAWFYQLYGRALQSDNQDKAAEEQFRQAKEKAALETGSRVYRPPRY